MTDGVISPETGDKKAEFSDTELIANRKRAFHATEGLLSDFDVRALNLLTTSFTEQFRSLGSLWEQIGLRTQGIPMMDIGGGESGAPQWLLNRLKPSEYTDVDLGARMKNEGVRKFVSADSLEHLLTVPDNSSNVISSAFLCRDWFAESDLNTQYLSRVFQNIGRVLPENGVFMATYFSFPTLAQQNGLVLNPELSRIKNDDLDGVFVFQKPTT